MYLILVENIGFGSRKYETNARILYVLFDVLQTFANTARELKIWSFGMLKPKF
jgi:hypothetical protein